MSDRPARRGLLRFTAIATAALLAFGGATTGALAQEPETPTSTVEPTPTSEPSAPPSTTDPTPPPTSTTEPAPPSSSDPAPPSSTPSSEPSTQPPAPTTSAETPKAPAQPTPGEQRNEPQKPAAELPNLKVTASIDKTHYQSHEPVRLKITVTNQSSFAAERVTASAWGIQVPYESWGDFAYPGTTLAPGETRTVEVSGSIATLNGDKLDVSGYVLAQAGDANQNDNHFHLNATVTQTVGNASGLVYADVNRNGKPDAGEPIEGAKVSIYGGSPTAEHRTTTDANGRFSFTGIPSGTYYNPYYELPGGWVVHIPSGQQNFTVAPNQTAELVGRAERPYSELMTAKVSLNKSTYAYPATARISVTLSNTSQYSLTGIQAGCNRVGDSNHLGFGPEWNAIFDKGVDLAPGETKSFTINEAIPEGAAKAGVVWLACDFQPNPGWNTDGPFAGAKAAVTGGKGRYTMWLADDKNQNHTRDAGEEVAGLKIALVHPNTGAQVAEATSDSTGTLEFVDVPVGTYRAVLLGPWDFRYGPDADQVTVVGWGSTAFVGLKPGAAPADIRAAVKFDKARYESHEIVHMSLTVTNVGGRTAEKVRLFGSPFMLDIPNEQWGDFRPYDGPGVQIPAGESRTFEASGPFREAGTNGRLTVWGSIDYLGRPNPSNSGYNGEIEVVQTKGAITGVAYTDKNHNGQQDAGEAAAGVVVEASGGVPQGYFKTTTDADGRYSFKDLPSGNYYVSYTFADGWLVHYDEKHTKVRVQPGAPVQLTGRGERPYHEVLSAKIELDQDVYEVGEDAKITITLTNRGDQVISGIRASCNAAGNSNQLGSWQGDGFPKGWGDLLPPGKGVTVGPGETKTFTAIEAVPEGAFEFGTVVVGCGFAPDPDRNVDGAYAGDSARVPGGFGSVTGELYYDRNGNGEVDQGEAIGNTGIFLRDDQGVDVAKAVTDDKGTVRFPKVPAGDYVARVDGPWKFDHEYGGFVRVLTDRESHTGFLVVPDVKTQPKPGGGDTTPAAGGGTAGGSGDALAKTGASVLGLGLVGALLVAFGFGASVLGRRRQTI
ncbi:SdrD B-like domain-containing protein [Lentzea aerocolonigenes]|uniref:SdrD B-like domain-containing protein n=1 Tax=Lentzea aerocolonigenes TaxID=68170 RepID=UPI0004C2CFEB|nr:SdrD B-like domain-containing protein [Lentzea aerocolonigenes]MCP2244632.1 Carboxypeptidase regulatory-like domain-containing protein [Lentzea aerocolonigenes]